MDIQNHLQRIRWEKNMTVERLSKLSGVSSSEITKIENNQVSPTLDTMCKLSHALNVHIWKIWNC